MTIAQQLNAKKFPFELYDANGKLIYFEDSNRLWMKYEYDAKGTEIYYENSKGLWVKRQYDDNGNEIYYENSYGYIQDNRK